MKRPWPPLRDDVFVRWPRVTAALVCVLAAWSSSARAVDLVNEVNDDLICPVDTPVLDRSARLRALSLDLRGRPVSLDELASFDGLDDVAGAALEEQLVDEWLASDDFAARVVRRHRSLLWPNLSPIEFSTRTLTTDARGLTFRSDGTVQERYRGLRGATCLDEPARFDADGAIVTTLDAGARREGFVMVRPFWSPGTPVKVCAFDAQDALNAADGADCSSDAAGGNPGCGCGPDLRWCLRASDQATLRASFLQDVDRRIAQNVGDDDSYLELLTGRRAFVNGPLAHFYRHLTKLPRFVKMDPSAVDATTLPADLTFAAADDWREVLLDADESGVLTSPAYLLRFQSNRARANRFFHAFLCQPFQPPAGGIEIVAGATDPDLQQRDGCKYCHAVLEPAAAHWGRSTEYGGGRLVSALYPAVREDCRRCALSGTGCSDDCNRYYLTKATTEEERAWLGTFRPYVFRSDEHVRNVENGPRLLVLSSVVDGRLQGCVARSTAEWLLGRPLGVNESDVADHYVRTFEDSGFSYRALVKAIVTSDLYRRVR